MRPSIVHRPMRAMSCRRFVAVAALAVLCASSAQAAWYWPWGHKKPPPKLMEQAHVVKDLYYGDALFYFYQDDYFDALTRIDAALTENRVPHHVIEARLLKGALYLSMGEHLEAGKIFKELLNENVSTADRNRAWFYLAKVWYQRGYYAQSEEALNSIAGKLAGDLESERILMHAEVLMAQNKNAEAAKVLEAVSKDDRYAPYARFNLGVALVREKQTAAALKLLDDVGQMAAPTEELMALRDKANLALGFTLLKENQPAEAAEKLSRVRLQGPLSNKALLGMGWADAAQKNYKAALVPWTELKGRNILDSAVQESYLAVPYAYTQLKATRQAVEQYSSAIQLYNDESKRIDESIAAIRQGRLLDAILEHDSADNVGWYWQLQKLPDAPETRYLYHLLATHEFQEGLKNYRDLKLMQTNLANWSLTAEAFQSMIDARRVAYKERLPVLNDILKHVDLDKLEAHEVDLGSRLAAIARDDDIVGLATAHEAEQWAKVKQVEAALAHADPSDPATQDMQEQLRMVRGVLYWDMNSSFKARLWHARKEQRELNVAVKEARRRWTLIDRARLDSPKQTEKFAVRVADIKPRIDNLMTRIGAAADAQNKLLADIAIRELQEQKQRLASYGVQAQFWLASIYDRAHAEEREHGGESGAPSDAPTPQPTNESKPESTPESTPESPPESTPAPATSGDDVSGTAPPPTGATAPAPGQGAVQ